VGTAHPSNPARDSVGTHIDRLKRDLAVLLDPDAPAAAEQLSVTDVYTVNDVEIRLRDYFGKHDACDAVTLLLNAELLGVATRKRLELSGRTAADPAIGAEVGAGERGTLPGVSTRYKLLRFRCKRCQAEAHRIHYDARELPTCGEHHPCEMEFQREA
jgi:hypothetical protein